MGAKGSGTMQGTSVCAPLGGKLGPSKFGPAKFESAQAPSVTAPVEAGEDTCSMASGKVLKGVILDTPLGIGEGKG